MLPGLGCHTHSRPLERTTGVPDIPVLARGVEGSPGQTEWALPLLVLSSLLSPGPALSLLAVLLTSALAAAMGAQKSSRFGGREISLPSGAVVPRVKGHSLPQLLFSLLPAALSPVSQ